MTMHRPDWGAAYVLRADSAADLLAGRYRLRDAASSEILLFPEGRFRYVGCGEACEGRWRRVGDAVLLTSDSIEAGGCDFRSTRLAIEAAALVMRRDDGLLRYERLD